MKRSTGLRNHMLVTGPLKSAMDGCVIMIYAGTEPASADGAIGGATLLCTISVNGSGTGVTLDASAASGAVTKSPSEVWIGDVLVSGQATFFRMQKPADAGGASTSAPRLQGSVGLIGADLNFSSVNLISGDARRINNFVASIPAG
ncbi:hypothetical protein [Pseudomonas sp. UBA7530]|uniref:hypothetical protein n=1 Tax=Pseudomonas sp. UBA7530 TaxID=1947341 RepID=UPI0025D5AEA1|nr:hypothetical protein [Pseudomonas sp. UBA7530]